MATNTILNRINPFFFGAGFLFLKFQNLPIPVLSFVTKLIGFSLYITAYLLWFVGTLLDSDQPECEDEWYGFAQYKEQFSLSAGLGIIACILSIVGIFFPPLLIPAAWLFLCTNLIWAIGEYHKFNKPPIDDVNYAQTQQSSNLSYSILISTITLITAITTTFVFIFPLITIPVIILSSIICLGLSLLAWEYWIDANYGDHLSMQTTEQSQNQLNRLLAPQKKHADSQMQDKTTSYNSGYAYTPIFSREVQDSSETELDVVYSSSPSRD